MANNKSNQNIMAIGVVALLALLGLNVYQFVNNRSLHNDNMVKETEIATLDQAKAELEKQYENSIAELNDMKTNNAELNTLIDSQKEELKIQKDKINLLLKDSKNLAAARKEMEGMKSKTQDYVNEINKLKQENQQLTDANTNLQKDKENLNQDLQKKTAENQQLSTDKTNLANEKEQLNQEKQKLNRKYNRAATIQVSKIKATAFEEKDGKKPNDVSKAKNANYIEVCFNTSANNNVDAGNEKFYIRILNPMGETEAFEDKGSGILVNEANNEQVRYSTKVDAEYNNKEEKVCGQWKNPNGFVKGNYQIEIYNKGYLVGTSNFKLK